MNKSQKQLSNTVKLMVQGAFPESFINAAAGANIELFRIQRTDACTILAEAGLRELPELENIARRTMCELETVAVSGISASLKKAKRAIVLLCFVAAAVVAVFCSTLFIWDIDISGNSSLTDGQILRVLADCGVSCGTYKAAIEPDMVRSRFLLQVPEAAWMSVNISGSHAQVLISERLEKPEIYDEYDACSISASKNGVIQSLSVLNGKPLAVPGQAVTKGETLISGIMDSITNAPRFVHALARVQAYTWYELTSEYPAQSEYKSTFGRSFSRFYLRIGKNIIKFSLLGGNGLDECDKIIYEYNLGVRNVFSTPVSLIREKYIPYESTLKENDFTSEAKERLLNTIENSIDGSVLIYNFTENEYDGKKTVTLRAQCLENIAQREEISQADIEPEKDIADDDRKND